MGYVDAAKKTTSVVDGKAYTVPSANVRTDISNIKYGAPVVYVYTTSTTDKTLHGLYVYPMTSTTGTVKSIAKENGAIVSVTLQDGTVLKLSAFWDRSTVNEWYVIGNVYLFALDTHGDIIYATKDTTRTLWAFTGESKYTNEFGAISSDWVTAYRFINVTTGEEQFFPIKNAASVLETKGYYDISVTATASGEYVATPVDGGDNTYAAGYIVDNWTVVESGTSSNFYNAKGSLGTVYFDGTTVTFLVATGTGAT